MENKDYYFEFYYCSKYPYIIIKWGTGSQHNGLASLDFALYWPYPDLGGASDGDGWSCHRCSALYYWTSNRK